MEDVNYLMKHSSENIRRPSEARLKEPQKLIRRSPEARLKECRPCTHPDPYQQSCPWTIAIKLLIKFPPGWDTVCEGHKPTVAPFAWQSNKAILFYFTQNAVSEIRLCTGAQRSSFQHHYPPIATGRQGLKHTANSFDSLEFSQAGLLRGNGSS